MISKKLLEARKRYRDVLRKILLIDIIPLILLKYSNLALEKGQDLTFRAVLSFMPDDLSKEKVDEYDVFILAATPYLIQLTERIVLISVQLRVEYIVSKEFIAPIFDRLAELYVHDEIESMIYKWDVNTPENIMLKYLLELSCESCKRYKNITSYKYLLRRIEYLLRNTWLSQVDIPRSVKLKDLKREVELRVKLGLTPREYEYLLYLGNIPYLAAIGLEHLYTLFELYALALIMKIVYRDKVSEVLTQPYKVHDNVKVYYQMPLDSRGCAYVDIAVSKDNKLLLYEVKLTNSYNYLIDSIHQVTYYTELARQFSMDVHAYLLYHTTQDDVRSRFEMFAKRCCKDYIDVIFLEVDEHKDIAKLSRTLIT